MKTNTYQRVNISLPEKTLRRIDSIAGHGDRSRLIDAAVNSYIAKHTREQLHKAIKEEAITWAKRDLEIAEEMFPLDNVWERQQ